ncbi:hypothetical protein BUALT_Bualt12G0109500 [Buddleja alternifolia]|uniref:Uncharacterized protein n=1 Tax=Buddleja alternifolia TaxID=168488 RepID=A0AAV6WX34_9LAMI|nr:hypothetical protein BUALT_Bualt12G0109500 [Buddleja alternifolia]
MMELDFESALNSLNVGTVNNDMNDLLESKSRESDSVDDLLGSHGVNSGVKEESKGAEFEDLIPGFGGASSLNVKSICPRTYMMELDFESGINSLNVGTVNSDMNDLLESKSRESDSVDDLLGSHGVNSSVKEKNKGAEFEDLIPGFGGTSSLNVNDMNDLLESKSRESDSVDDLLGSHEVNYGVKEESKGAEFEDFILGFGGASSLNVNDMNDLLESKSRESDSVDDLLGSHGVNSGVKEESKGAEFEDLIPGFGEASSLNVKSISPRTYMMDLDFESGINSLNVGTVNSDMNDLLESKSRESNSVDDLLGSHGVNSGVKEESKGAEFEDLISGFGGASSLNVKSICPRTYMMELDFESGIHSLNVGTVNSDMNDLLESKSRVSDSVDDLVGSHRVNSGVKEESKGAEFEDLIPGFGGASSLNVKYVL